jgi:DNA-binding response OmpR family regulator
MKILVIEDEKDIRDFITEELKFAGMEVMALENGLTVMSVLDSFDPNVILTDQLMPGKSGVEIIKEVRSNPKYASIPVMMITALGSEGDKVKAFDIGADDYVTKPFMGKEVVARVKALARRISTTKNVHRLLKYKNLEVDFSAHRVTLEGHDVPLTLTEFKILGELIKQMGSVLSRDSLREKALGNLHVTDRTIDVHMASLRKKLLAIGDDIETVRGVGYRLSS